MYLCRIAVFLIEIWDTGYLAVYFDVQPLKSGKIHDVQDDMESFFHVALYHGLRYMSHNLDPTELSFVMAHVFDEFNIAAQRRGSQALDVPLRVGIFCH